MVALLTDPSIDIPANPDPDYPGLWLPAGTLIPDPDHPGLYLGVDSGPPDPAALDALAVYCQAPVDSPYLARCLTDATLMVTNAIGGAQVPDFARARAVLEVAADLWHRRQAHGGIAAFDAPNGPPMVVRIARDAMRAGWPYLAPYLPGGFA